MQKDDQFRFNLDYLTPNLGIEMSDQGEHFHQNLLL